MFTAKIMNYTFPQVEQNGSCHLILDEPELASVYIREWDCVEVWYPASVNYKEKVEQLQRDVVDTHKHDLSKEELEDLVDMQETYKAFVTYTDCNGDDSFYCIAEYEEVYITDSKGNTVHSIR